MTNPRRTLPLAAAGPAPLPRVAARAAQTSLCTYCPKLCRPACPVSTVEGRETVTPWGKMRAVDELRRGASAPDEAGFAPVYACSGCLRCRAHCELDNPVADVLRDARADALVAGAAPTSVRAVVEGFAERQRALAARADEAGLERGERGAAAVGFLPGCTAVATADAAGVERVRRGAAMLARWYGGPTRVVAGSCCGAPLWEAGDLEGFALLARALAASFEGVPEVVVADAGCAYALRVGFARVGVATPPVRHLSEAAAARLDALPAGVARPERALAYHDSCRLGRGLGVYDAPRAVLARVLGVPPRELPETREGAACSGAGGLLPRTRPAAARAVAAELAGQAREVAAAEVVTGCAASRRALEAQGVRGLELLDVLLEAGA